MPPVFAKDSAVKAFQNVENSPPPLRIEFLSLSFLANFDSEGGRESKS
jgi:hypothetical protein